MIDWKTIETEYVTGDISHRGLAEKYGICRSTICKKAADDKWSYKRKEHRAKTVSKAVEKISNKKADKMSRIDDLADKLLEKLEQAISELDMQLYKHTDKTKVIEYSYDLMPGKPTKETIHEEEKLLETRGIVDRMGLKQIASALKDVKEVKMLRSELDRQEQQARIDKLRKEAAVEKENNEVKVTILGELEAYSE